VAGLAFALAAPLTYLGERFYERLRAGRINPAAIVSEVHATFYWRVALATWCGSVIAVLVFQRARSEQRGGAVPGWLVVALLLLAPFSIFWAVRFP
jgi:hypothetical protein